MLHRVPVGIGRRAIRVPHQTDKLGIGRTTTVKSMSPMTCWPNALAA
jgi:hypothetical protein